MERRHRYFFADDEQHVLVSRPRADQSGDAGCFGLRADAFVQPAFCRAHARFYDGVSRVDWRGILEALLRVGTCGIECDADRQGCAVSDADGGKRLGAPRKYRVRIDSRQRHRAAADRLAEEAETSRPIAWCFPYRQAGAL